MRTDRWPHGDDERCYRCGEAGATDVDHDHDCPWHGPGHVCTMCYRGMACRKCNVVEIANRDNFRRQWKAMGGSFEVATETWEAL